MKSRKIFYILAIVIILLIIVIILKNNDFKKESVNMENINQDINIEIDEVSEIYTIKDKNGQTIYEGNNQLEVDLYMDDPDFDLKMPEF